ncbi:hypothetical protein [Nocardioides sp.]|uniref:hypothetical protein n=1 Tax=Nocardioides sp. TaxID=35761 RepID=UPI0035616A4E
MLAAAILVAAIVAAVAAGRWGRPGAVALAVFSLWWLLVNKPLEGPVLISFGGEHGLVATDLVGLVGVGLAGLVWWRPPVSTRLKATKSQNP